MSETEEAEAESFAEFIERRHSQNRPVAAYVVGDLHNEPPLGNAAAARIANIMAGDDGEVLHLDPTDAERQDVPDNVGAVRVTLPTEPVEAEWRTVMRRMLSRVPSDIDFAVLVDQDEIPAFCKELGDVRVIATGIDETLQFHRVKHDPYSGDVYYREMSGLHGRES